MQVRHAAAHPPNILVVGASGTLARLIVADVIATFGMGALTVSDYRQERLHALAQTLAAHNGDTPRALVLDITAPESIRRGIRDADYVIVPVAQQKPLIQEACIEQGIVCVDLAVAAPFIDTVLALQPRAHAAGALLLPAAGLFPGFSGILAKAVHAAAPQAVVDVGLLQSTNGMAGPTGIADMLQLFGRDVAHITATETRMQPGFSHARTFRLDDRFGARRLRLAHFMERTYLEQQCAIRANYWSAFDAERFNQLIAFLRAAGVLRIFAAPRFRLRAAAFIAARKQATQNEVVGLFAQTDDDNRCFVAFESDYGATSACAVAFVALLHQQSRRPAGVYFPFELFDCGQVLRAVAPRVVTHAGAGPVYAQCIGNSDDAGEIGGRRS